MKPLDPKPLPPGTKQVLIGFDLPDFARTTSPATTFARPVNPTSYSVSTVLHRPFLPLGLLLWGVTDASRVLRVTIGNRNEMEMSGTAIPGRYFETGHTFDELTAFADKGQLQGALHPRQVLACEEASPGMHVGLELSGPCAQACLWGLTYTGRWPSRRVVIEKSNESFGVTYSGKVIERRLGGDEVTVDVTAPEAALVAQLLSTLSH